MGRPATDAASRPAGVAIDGTRVGRRRGETPALDGDGYPPVAPEFDGGPAGAEEESSASAPHPRGVPDPRADGALPSAPRANSAPTRPLPDASFETSSTGTRLTRFAPRSTRRAIPPARYGFEDSLTLEPLGYGAVAALADVETLTDAWTPRREAWSLAGDVAGAAPDWMSGPDPEDLLEDEDGEGFGGTARPCPRPRWCPRTKRFAPSWASSRRRNGARGRRNGARTNASSRRRRWTSGTASGRAARARRMAARADALNARVSDPKLRWEM